MQIADKLSLENKKNIYMPSRLYYKA